MKSTEQSSMLAGGTAEQAANAVARELPRNFSGGDFDVAVIGAGFGGLAAALTLAEAGAKVVVFERLNYAGGCASTFSKAGYRFESGATLFSGFGPGQLFERWVRRHKLDVELEWIDPLVEFRTPDWKIKVGRERQSLLQTFLSFDGAPKEALQRFFAFQEARADLLWDFLERPDALPPWSWRGGWRELRGLLSLTKHVPRSLALLPWMGKSMQTLLHRFGLQDFEPLCTYLDGVCQITVQCGLKEVEAPFALASMDYFWRGTGHVRHGIGQLAHELVRAIEVNGGLVVGSCEVRSLHSEKSGWQIETRRGTCRVQSVLANLLPPDLLKLTGAELQLRGGVERKLKNSERSLKAGWGACMLYRVVTSPAEGSQRLGLDASKLRRAAHYQLVQDATQPLMEGNHLFCSLSSPADMGRAPKLEQRTMTVSTHVPMADLLARSEPEQAEHVQAIQSKMRQGLEQLLPEWDQVHLELPASPRTFQRFTGRSHGMVGGVPRRKGWHSYFDFGPRRVARGLHLIGDTTFPGQSTLAVALGGVRTAQQVLREELS